MLIDLHTHSTASDGTKSPSQLVELALARQAQTMEPAVLALTDHDTVAGVLEFQDAAASYKDRITAIAGMEISSHFKGEEIHILGYGMDCSNEALLQTLKIYRDDRDSRNSRILKKMNELGFDIAMEDLRPSRPGASIGRPSMAMWLLEHGHVTSVNEAFERYLSKGKPCYIPRKKPSLLEAVTLIHASGGIAVLAHPVLYKKLTSDEVMELIESLVDMGLDGMEIYYSRNKEKDTLHFLSLAKKYHLLQTGGTDYHGAVKPDLSLFSGTGNLKVPDSIIEPFFEHLKK